MRDLLRTWVPDDREDLTISCNINIYSYAMSICVPWWIS